MEIFCTKRRVLNDLDAYISGLGYEPIEIVLKEIGKWGDVRAEELAELISGNKLEEYMNWQERYARLINEVLAPMWLGALERGALKATKNRIILSDSLDDVKAWMASRSGELITSLSEESRGALRAVLLKWQGELLDARRMARQVIPLIGLTARQTDSNERYRREVYETYLEGNGNKERAIRESERLAGRYAVRQLKSRAESIVKTELSFAYNNGAHMGVRRAIRQGLMSRCEMVWSTAGVIRTCPRCLELKGKVVGYTDEEGVQIPPLHPRCRCVIIYRETGGVD